MTFLLALFQSFHELVPLAQLGGSGLSPGELALLLGGRESVDVDSLRAHVIYQGSEGFGATHFLCVWLWQLMHEFDESTRRGLLQFVTGCDRVPLDGFEPPFNVTEGVDMERDSLPKAHTCFNQLVLPPYSSYDLMKKRIEFAMQNTSSFELS